MSELDDLSLLERLVQEVLTSPKYRDISPALVHTIGMQELTRRRNFKEAVKATKNKLHQVAGAYLDGRESYPDRLIELQAAIQTGDAHILRQVCKKVMSHHASTRERLPILDQFYSTLLSDLTPISSILDIACGLNPLAIPWLPLTSDATYYAYDIYQPMIDFLNAYMSLLPIKGRAQRRDVLQSCPTERVDVAFLLKTIPCLEQIDRKAGYNLLRTINARYLIVSFPVHSLGGYNKGMLTHYTTHLHRLLEDTQWEVHNEVFATELAFIIKKDAH
jgi:16S rRNA (guanine(1405)-N(7))-methyltransferase